MGLTSLKPQNEIPSYCKRHEVCLLTASSLVFHVTAAVHAVADELLEDAGELDIGAIAFQELVAVTDV